MTVPAIVLCAHGTRSAAGRAAIDALATAVAAASPGAEVLRGYVDVQPPAIDVLCARLSGRRGVLVPLLLSPGYHVNVDLVRAAARAPGLELAPPLGQDERVTDVLFERLAEVSARPGDAVVLAAAGSTDARALAGIDDAAARLAARLGTPVTAAHLTAARPSVTDAVAQARRRLRASGPPGARVVVATYLLAPGHFAGRASRCGADLVTAPLLPDAGEVPGALVDLVLDRARVPVPAGA